MSTSLNNQLGQRGFTLVELVVTIAVIGVLAAMAAPSMTAMIENGRMQGQASELAAALQQARSEAVRRNATVTICPSSDGSTCTSSGTWAGWIIHGLDRTVDPAVDELIHSTTASTSILVTGPAAGIEFRPSGLIASEEKLQVAASDKKACLTVKISGLVSIANGACS